jgi:FixJ family two-component response regulator
MALQHTTGIGPCINGLSHDLAPRVFVIIDNDSLRESIEDLVRCAGCAVESFASAEAFLARLPPVIPGCLVLNVKLPGLSGLDLQGLLASRAELPVVFVASRADVPTSVRAMKAGAVDFLTEPLAGGALLAAIRDAFDLSRAAIRRGSEMRAVQSRYSLLTRREREVMEAVVAGLLNKQVAGQLGISEITVKVHRGRVMRKMNAGSLPALVTMASRLEPVNGALVVA